jgi:hypothetical protein
MSRLFQRLLLAIGVVALVALLVEMGLSLAATLHGSTPARVVHVKAGPYPLTVSLYTYPANAGFALPFAVAPQQPQTGPLTIDVTSFPGKGVDATPIHTSLSPDANVRNGVQGTAEITVQGPWSLQVSVDGPAGHATVAVPLEATAPPPVPQWLGWTIGLIPLFGLLAFLLIQRSRKGSYQLLGAGESARSGS